MWFLSTSTRDLGVVRNKERNMVSVVFSFFGFWPIKFRAKCEVEWEKGLQKIRKMMGLPSFGLSFTCTTAITCLSWRLSERKGVKKTCSAGKLLFIWHKILTSSDSR